MQGVSQHLRSSFFILKAFRGRLAREIFAGALGWKTCLGGLETLRGRLAPRKPLLSVGDERYKTAAASFSAPISVKKVKAP